MLIVLKKGHENDKSIIQNYFTKETKVQDLQKECENVDKYIDNNILIIIDMLEKDGYVISNVIENKYALTQKGLLATHLRETHCLVFANLIQNNLFDELSSKQLVAIFSCFTNISVPDDLKSNIPYSDDKVIQNMVIKIQNMYDDYKQKEIINYINTGTDYNIHFDLLNYVTKWCDCESIEDCKYFLQNLQKDKEIFLGEFIKAILKINNITSEMEKVAEMVGDLEFLSVLKQVPQLTLKFVATNQSLYV